MNRNHVNVAIGGSPCFLLVFILTLLAWPCFAGVISVCGDSIQDAINASVHGDEIIVCPGTYVENINFGGKNIVLRSTDPTDPAVVASTVIDGNAAGPVVTFSGIEDETCILAGFTITNGFASFGGGVDGNGTYATIQNNTISGNSADRGGGLAWCDGTIQNNTISGNSAGRVGGGLYDCDGTIQNNTVSGNSAERRGGGLAYCDGAIQNNTIWDNSASERGGGLYHCGGTIQNNTISGNSASERGGGLAWCHGTIQNNTISGNSAQYGGGLAWCHGAIQNNTIWDNSAGDDGGGLYHCKRTIKNCIIWENDAPEGAQLYTSSTPSYSCIQDWSGSGVGNITDDPLLVELANGHLHLQPGSPCIDTGGNVPELTEDFEGDPRPWDDPAASGGDGSNYDMGADEWFGDVNGDGEVNAIDIQLVINAALGIETGYDCDLDGDGYVDAVDIQLVINAVLRSK